MRRPPSAAAVVERASPTATADATPTTVAPSGPGCAGVQPTRRPVARGAELRPLPRAVGVWHPVRRPGDRAAGNGPAGPSPEPRRRDAFDAGARGSSRDRDPAASPTSSMRVIAWTPAGYDELLAAAELEPGVTPETSPGSSTPGGPLGRRRGGDAHPRQPDGQRRATQLGPACSSPTDRYLTMAADVRTPPCTPSSCRGCGDGDRSRSTGVLDLIGAGDHSPCRADDAAGSSSARRSGDVPPALARRR